MSIVLTDLTKQFGDLLIVDHVSLEIADGELFVLLGASGSGKSTILRLISGLLPPDNGLITLHGRDVTWLPPQERGVGFVFQNYSIFRHMSVADNVEFGLKIRRVPIKERATRREELLHLVGLAGLGNRFPNQLSGGQQQRVALARALAYEPAVLLLDEPFSALDVKIRGLLRRTLKQIQQQLGVTTILVTHDQEEAFELADRIGVMDRGHLLEIGSPETIYHQPKTPFAATFVGAGTVLVGRAEDDMAHFGALQLPIPETVPHEDGLSVQMLVRPEQIRLTAERPSPEIPVLGLGTIAEQTFAGALRRLRLRVPRLPGTRQISPFIPFGEGQMLVDALLPATEPLPGNQIWVSLAAWHILEQPRLHLLVYDTGAGPTGALDIARQIQEAFLAVVTVVAVAERNEAVAGLQTAVRQRMQQAGLGRAELRLREGDTVEQLNHEQAGAGYDFLLLTTDELPGQLNSTISTLIAATELPFFLVRHQVKSIKHLLICTAAGEPGKQDVRVGGRLARRLGAEVTLLHTVVTTGELDLPQPVQLHLEKAISTLQALDIKAASMVTQADSATTGILAELNRGAYDCVVIGRHVSAAGLFDPDNVMMRVLEQTDYPILVVPERR
ncbi:MAG: ATP-binding cassette domain-containing protein [Anaerolineales bacterium]|nr:ATP-binding cassette domain-containing protein [Anaerolineales bacterium]